MAADPADAAIVRSTVELAHRLGFRAIVEGVEDQRTWDLATEFGCDLIQGFHATRPLEPDRLVAWVHERRAASPLLA